MYGLTTKQYEFMVWLWDTIEPDDLDWRKIQSNAYGSRTLKALERKGWIRVLHHDDKGTPTVLKPRFWPRPRNHY